MTLVIHDLEYSIELDRSAQLTVLGGFDTLFSLDQLLAGVTNGDLSGNIDLTSTGNIFSPTIVTSLNLYLPVSTIVQIDLDEIVNTDQIIGSNISAGTV